MSHAGFSKSSEAEQEHLPPEKRAWPVWPWLLLIVGLAIVMVIRAGLIPDVTPRGPLEPPVGSRLGVFRLEGLTGDTRPVGLEDLTVKATLVNFWGPWCGPCRIEFPHLMELVQHFRSESEFQFFSVSSNPDPLDETGLKESTEQFLKDQRADISTYRDPQAETTKAVIQAAKLDNFGYPTTVLLGPEGEIHAVWPGFAPGDEKSMREAIEKLLAVNQK